MDESGIAEVRRRVPNGALRGMAWGLGLAAFASQALMNQTTSSYGSLPVMFFETPLILLVSVVLCAFAYRSAARAHPRLVARGSWIAAILGASILAGIPPGVQTVQLNAKAAEEIPTYPGAERLHTEIYRGPAARIVVTLHTTAKEDAVTAYYTDAWRKRGWSTNVYGGQVTATKTGQVMFITVNRWTGNATANWFRTVAGH